VQVEQLEGKTDLGKYIALNSALRPNEERLDPFVSLHEGARDCESRI
jgi:hypothetical protein